MSEKDWIQRYIKPLVSAAGADGLNDDVAILESTGVIIATMDTLVEGVHFLPHDPIATVGQKLVRVNVSDIRSKGAIPLDALCSVAWPALRPEADFADLMRGLSVDLSEFSISLVGGDFVRTEGPLTLTLSLTGRTLGSVPVRRSGGEEGHSLYISGEIGWGGIGLAASRNHASDHIADHYRVPNISSSHAARIVADNASASMDVSDGLLTDAISLAVASGCGVSIDLERVPLAKPSSDLNEILAQCTAGDDYQTLMSASVDTLGGEFKRIGMFVPEPGLHLRFQGQRVEIPSTLGYEH